jgi:hypothetical protein
MLVDDVVRAPVVSSSAAAPSVGVGPCVGVVGEVDAGARDNRGLVGPSTWLDTTERDGSQGDAGAAGS